MSETDTETTLCDGCALPITAPKPEPWGPFLCFARRPLCKDCLLNAKLAHFEARHLVECPYKVPHWRPKR